MPSLEQSVKGQFEKVFDHADWKLFKTMADISFSEAAFLKRSDFERVAPEMRLLVRNSRKRLLVGIGAELLVKAVYLKTGHCINCPEHSGCGLKPPFKLANAGGEPLDKANTYTFDKLINPLKTLIKLRNPDVVINGLKIAKVFRNKEGHVVTSKHAFVPESFQAIEKALMALYLDAFNEHSRCAFQ